MTPEAWSIGDPADNPPNGIRIVDVQDVTIATIWRQPYDSPEWAEGNARLIAKAPELFEALSQVSALIESRSLEIGYMDRRATEVDVERWRALLTEIDGLTTAARSAE